MCLLIARFFFCLLETQDELTVQRGKWASKVILWGSNSNEGIHVIQHQTAVRMKKTAHRKVVGRNNGVSRVRAAVPPNQKSMPEFSNAFWCARWTL
jgi:hypothetical protein